MTELGGIERMTGAPAAVRVSQPSLGTAFAVPAAADTAPPLPVSALGASGALSGLLALQEAGGAPVRDREARRRGRDILGALTELQRALLGGLGSDGAITRLSALLADLPMAADPRLNAILAAIRLRARVELARRQGGC
ncbi:MAG: flagellar assembly protein FliX [Acetobacteraceae bacterium]